MKASEFNKILNARCKKMKSILTTKADEYASSTDRLHNFKAAGRMSNTTPEAALKGMAAKHAVSVQDMIDHPEAITLGLIDEKIGDCINYLVLLEALMLERCEDLIQQKELIAEVKRVAKKKPYDLQGRARKLVANGIVENVEKELTTGIKRVASEHSPTV